MIETSMVWLADELSSADFRDADIVHIAEREADIYELFFDA